MALFLALPGSALAAPLDVSGPAAVDESAGKATYTVACGDTPNPLAPLPPPTIPNTGPVTVTVADGPAPAATAGSDYGAHTQTLPHSCLTSSSFTFDVPITNDAADEQDEQFTVTVSGASVPPSTDSMTTRITDDDPMASVTPLIRVIEGDAGTSSADVTVTLSSAPVIATTIGYATENASALSGSDYTATSGQLVFAAGEQSKTISIPIIGDTTTEKVEAFYLNLVSTTNGALNPTQKQAGIAVFDNDKPPVPAFALLRAVTVTEGDSGTVNTLFTVTLSSAATERAQVAWKTADFTATSGDYGRRSGTVVFEPGQTSKTVSVDVRGDRRDEPNEAFGVILEKPVGGTLAAAKTFGIITDDDGPKVKIGRPVRKGKALVALVECPATASLCKGRLVVTFGRTRAGRASFDVAKGQGDEVRVKLSRKARKALRKKRRRMKFAATTADASGAQRITNRRFRVKRFR
jgi:hypothetical protein